MAQKNCSRIFCGKPQAMYVKVTGSEGTILGDLPFKREGEYCATHADKEIKWAAKNRFNVVTRKL
jgi:hypothetical protein